MSLDNIVKLNTELEAKFIKRSAYKSIIFTPFATLIKTVTSK